MQRQSQVYGQKDFQKRIKNHFFVLMVKALFNLVTLAYEHKQYKSTSAVALNLADAFISEVQSDMKVELSKVIRGILRGLTGAVDTSTCGLSSSRSTSALNMMQAAF